MIIIPSIDLRDGKVVRLKQGDYSQQLNYPVDPLETARAFAAAGAKLMHVVDLDGAKEGRPMQADLIAKIAGAAGIPVQVGGGIRKSQDIDLLLQAGISRIVVGTKAMEDWPWFEAIAHDTAYQNRIVLALDAKDGKVAVRGWTHTTSQTAVEVAAKISDWPLAAILYTDVAKDGMMLGPNFPQTRAIAQAGKIPVIASGGVGTLDHIRQLAKLPLWGAIIGRSLYEGRVDLREAISAAGE
jgi:phosphoribosylformimino-5-aminoimidazole carboxamide ribotide isomerase